MPKKILPIFLFLLLLCGTVSAKDVSYVNDKDINEASADDTRAYNIYIGKTIADVDAAFAELPGWEKRPHDKAARMYHRKGNDYVENVYVYAMSYNKDVVGSYRISYFTKTKEAADDIFYNTTKNFSYIIGSPSIKRGMSSAEWFINDTLKISVEYMEYDPRLPVAKNYPFEIAIKRISGDYHKFFQPSKATP